MNQLYYTAEAKKQRDTLIGSNSTLEQAFQFTEQGLREKKLAPGKCCEPVLFTRFRLEIDVERDHVMKITTIEIRSIVGDI